MTWHDGYDEIILESETKTESVIGAGLIVIDAVGKG